MHAVDTNIVVRLLTGDDVQQTRRATALFKKESIFIPKTVLLETEWVLRRLYRLDGKIVVSAFRKLGGLANCRVRAAFNRESGIELVRGGDGLCRCLASCIQSEQQKIRHL